MSDLTRIGRLAAEAPRIAVTQPVASAMTLLVAAAAVALLLATTGQTVVAERQVLGQIDDVGTRSIEVDLDPAAGATADAVARVARLATVEWTVGFGDVVDIHNENIPGGTPVALRPMYGDPPPVFRFDPANAPPLDNIAWAGTTALARLGLQTGFGGVATGDGALSYAIVGTLLATEPLEGFDRQAITPMRATPNDRLRRLLLVTNTHAEIGPTTDTVMALLDVDEPSAVTIRTSERLAALRAAVAGELGEFGRDLVSQTLGAALAIVLLVTYGTTAARRREFGRRRALGATRPAIVMLVVLQQAVIAVIGTLVGLGVGTVISLQLTGSPPDAQFAFSVAILVVLGTILSALIPAAIAATRDPVTILRVP